MKEQHQDDQILIDKFGQTGDQVWLLRLFQKYEHLIYGICLKYSQDPDWSKDLKAQIYEKLVGKAKNLKTDNFKYWLFSICKNHCIDALRSKGRKVATLEKYKKYQIDHEELVYFSHEQRLIIEEDRQSTESALENAANNLPFLQRQCIDLFYNQRLSYVEISQEVGIDHKQIKSHLQNGKRNMRRFIYNHYNLLD